MNLPPLAIEPLSKAVFAPFGTVIERDGADIRMINEGTTTRFHALSDVDVAREGGTPVLSIFAGTPRPVPIAITMLERHPLGSQSFMPLSDEDWLVVVAPTNSDDSAPAFDALRCFSARGDQGVTYAPGVWHHPLLVLAPQEFLIADRAGPAGEPDAANLQEALADAPVAVITV